MTSHASPILTLNNELLGSIIELVVEIDFRAKLTRINNSGVQRQRRAALTRAAGPLLAFSMTCKHIRAVALPFIFRNFVVRLTGCHYHRPEFDVAGTGIIKKDNLTDELSFKVPEHAQHARALSIKLAPYNPVDSIPPWFVPVGLQSLIERPTRLRRLCVQVPTVVITRMAHAASYKCWREKLAVFRHVEDLIVCGGCEYIVMQCPNTRTLAITAPVSLACATAPLDDDYRTVFSILEHASRRCRSLAALRLAVPWTAAVVNGIHRLFPGLEELHCHAAEGGEPLGRSGMIQAVARFPRLRAVGMSGIHGIKPTLANGVAVGPDGRFARQAWSEMAASLLWSAHHPELWIVEFGDHRDGRTSTDVMAAYEFRRNWDLGRPVVKQRRIWGRHPWQVDWDWHAAKA